MQNVFHISDFSWKICWINPVLYKRELYFLARRLVLIEYPVKLELQSIGSISRYLSPPKQHYSLCIWRNMTICRMTWCSEVDKRSKNQPESASVCRHLTVERWIGFLPIHGDLKKFAGCATPLFTSLSPPPPPFLFTGIIPSPRLIDRIAGAMRNFWMHFNGKEKKMFKASKNFNFKSGGCVG